MNYFLIVFLMLFGVNSVQAEYRAITKFPTPEAGKDKNGKPLELPDRQADETDFKACQAITDNINAMEKYHVQWECDFPISANNYLLSKPQWTEVTGEEKRKALDVISPNRQDKDGKGVSVFGFPYNVDAIEGDEKIYVGPYSGYECKSGSTDSRTSFWPSGNSRLPLLINRDIVIFSSRLYFIQYFYKGYREKEDFRSVPPKSFLVTTLKVQEPYTGLKVLSGVCAIRQ